MRFDVFEAGLPFPRCQIMPQASKYVGKQLLR